MLSGKEIFDEMMATTNKRRAKTAISKATEKNLIKVLKLIYAKNPQKAYKKNFKKAIGILRDELLAVQKAGSEEIQKDVSKAEPIPYEIRVIVSHIIYRAMELTDGDEGKVSQAALLEKLGLGHNSFTKWGMRPKQYYHVTHYKQPDSPIHYMGAKTGDYGYAVRNLVYQSGKYKAFADIFGGGGNATLAIAPIDKMKYYYNEFDPVVFNAVKVLADVGLCKDFVGLYREFCDELHGKGRSKFLAGYLPPDAVRQAISDAYNSKSGKTKDQVGIIKDVKVVSVSVTYDEMRDFLEEYDKGIDRCIACGQTDIDAGGKTYNLQKLKNKDYHNNIWWKYRDPVVRVVSEALGVVPRGHHVALADDSIGDGFEDDIPSNVTRDDNKLFKKYLRGIPLTSKEQERLGELEISAVGQRFDFVHYMMLCYWYLFEDTVKKYRTVSYPFATVKDKVFCAFAFIFLRYFAFRKSRISDNDIRNADSPTALSDRSTVYKNNEKIEKFLNQSLLPEIKAFSKRFRNVELLNKDFRDFIDGFMEGDIAKGSMVFYSDSPYLKTVGYDSAFTSGDMRDLIKKLVYCGQKFIFSCRACKSAAKSKEAGEGKPSIKSANLSLRDDLFHVFKSEAQKAGISLNVLAIEKGGRDLASHIRESRVAEIMICNFDIHDFSNTGRKSKTKFTAYTYQDFLRIFESNAVL